MANKKLDLFAGSSSQPSLDELFARTVTIQPQEQEAPEKEGIFRSIAKSLARPFAKAGVSALALGQATGELLTGDVAGAQEAITRERQVPLVGGVRPIGIGEEGERQATGKFARDVIGTGLDIGSTLVGGTGLTAAGKAAGRGLIKEGAKLGTKSGLLTGATGAAGMELQEGGTLGQVAKETAVGGVVGAGLGSIFGALEARGLIKAGQKAQKAREKAEEFYTKAFQPTKEKQKENLSKAMDYLLDKKWVGTRSQLMKKVDDGIDMTTNQYEELGELDGLVGLDGLFGVIDDKLKSYKRSDGTIKSTMKTKYKALKNAKDDILSFTTYKDGIQNAQAYAEDLRRLAQEYGDEIYGTRKSLKTVTDNKILSQQKFVDDKIRILLGLEKPKYKAINDVFSNVSKLKEVLEETITRTKPQSGALHKITDLAFGVTGLGGSLLGGGFLPAALGGAAISLHNIAKSSWWQTMKAARQAKIYEKLSQKSQEEVIRWVEKASRIGIKAVNELLQGD